MCGLSVRPLAQLNIDINISLEPHIGRDPQTPAHTSAPVSDIAPCDLRCPLSLCSALHVDTLQCFARPCNCNR